VRVGDLLVWARGDGLEIVLLVLGALLLTRALDGAATRVTARLQTTTSAGAMPIASEQAKHVFALVQAVNRLTIGLVWFIIVVLVLMRANVPLTTLVAPATIVGLALGFGAQRLVGDLLSGFFLISERQYGIGDVIQLLPPGQMHVTGTVEEVTLRVTKIRTAAGDVVTTANGEIRQLVNCTKDWSRAVVDLPVRAAEDLERVSALLHEVGTELVDEDPWRGWLLDPPAVLGVESLDLDQMQVRVSARTLPGRQFEVSRELRRRSVLALRTAGVSLGAAP
jgi:small-conductance mechanosensitive channel